jgi:DHA2 family multidrug resistance protein
MTSPPEQGWHSPVNPWVTAVVATLAPFMEVLDTSIANVALPHIAGSMGASVQDSTWVLTSYLVSNAIVLTISAWCSSVLGRRNFYMLCVALFTGSSFLCGLAPNLGALVVLRLLQGLGGGGLQPSTQAILVDTFPPRKRGLGMAVYGMTVVVAPIIGPTLGGWITDNFSWRWIFFINVPVGILSLALASQVISDPPYLPRRRGADRFRVDWIGLGLLALGLGLFQIILDLGERHDWFDSPAILAGTAVAATSLVLLILWELGNSAPIIDLRLLKERNLAFSTFIMVIFGMILYGSIVLLPLFMQTLLGYTATWSGLAISPGGVVVMILMPLVGWLISRVDARWMILFGVVTVSYSLFMMGAFSTGVDFRTIVMARLVQGLGLAFMFVPINTSAYAYVPKEQRNGASSLISLARNIGGSFGISLVTSLLARRSQAHLSSMVGHLTPLDPAFAERLGQLVSGLRVHPADPVDRVELGRRVIWEMALGQARALAYVDLFRYLAVAFLVLVPLVLLMRRARTALGEPSSVH